VVGLSTGKVFNNKDIFNGGVECFLKSCQRPNILVKVLTAGEKAKRTLFQLTEKRLEFCIFNKGESLTGLFADRKGKGKKQLDEGEESLCPPPQEMKISTI
jgi:hypothetical protein